METEQFPDKWQQAVKDLEKLFADELVGKEFTDEIVKHASDKLVKWIRKHPDPEIREAMLDKWHPGRLTFMDKEDGRWWIRCKDKKCGNEDAYLELDQESFKSKDNLSVDWEMKLVCGKCSGDIEFHRVEIKGTVDV